MAKITVDLKGKFPHELAEEDPKLMQIWGEVNNAWDEIERLLYVAFDAMLPEESHFATQAVFYSQTSHAARRKMVSSLAKYALMNRPVTAKKLKNAIKRVSARADDRHNLTHGTWVISTDLKTGKTEAVRTILNGELIPNVKNDYGYDRLQRVKRDMLDTASTLREAITPIDEAKRANLIAIMEREAKKAKPLEP